MLSGIGPSSELKRHGIAVIVDLPGVGQNMWDHPSFGLSTGVNLENAITKEGMAQAEAMWNANRNGPWSSSNVDAIGFTNFPEDIRKSMSPETIKELDSFPSDWPDIEQFGSPAYAGNQSGFAAPPDPTKNYASTTYILIKTVSRGTITLNSADPNDLPKLDPGYLTHPADKEIALATFKFGRRVLHSDAFKPLLSDPDVPEVFPGPSVSTDEEILGWIAEQASHVWHAAGTCKMGKEEDKMAVVDSKARVRRVKNLRVVDASIFPLLPPGHLTATVYVVAEKIAEDMLNDAKSDHVDKSEL